jgi:methyl-accepting chemotaxis protein
MLNFLKAKWTLIGLEAPIISWLIVVILLVGAIVYWVKLVRLFLSLKAVLAQTNQAIAQTRARYPEERKGLPAQAYDEVSQHFEQAGILKSCWQRFNHYLISRLDERNNQDYFWASESATDSFSESAIIGSRVNLSFCQSLPGIITGIGLLFTFIAILIALLDVRLVNNRVQGIELLIQGLSGKFISSIVALFLATIHLVIEKGVFNQLRRQCNQLADTLDCLFPNLTNPKILEEVRLQVAEQTNALRSFNSSLAPALKAGITEGVGPMLSQMASSIEGLNQLLRQSEAQKQESITGSIEKLLKDLQISLTDSIDQMSRAFTETLSTNAKTEFSHVIESLSGTASLLNGMNAQFENTQKRMDELIAQANRSTYEQFEEGRRQIKSMTSELGKMLTQMTQQFESNAATTAGAAQEIMAQANNWSTQNGVQIEQMIDVYQQQFASVEELRQAFTASLGSFTEAIGKHGVVMNEMRQITNHFSAIATSVKEAIKETQTTQQSLQQVAARAEAQAEHLAEANERQEEMWRDLQTNLHKYKNTFEEVGKAADELLNQINGHLKNYTDTTHSSFQQLVNLADNHFSNATNKLGASVEELDEVLGDLADTLARIPQNGKR